MRKIYPIIACVLIFLSACGTGFNTDETKSLLEKKSLTTEDISRLLEIYEDGISDAIEFSKMDNDKLSAKQREEVMLIFGVGMRLSKEEGNMTPVQKTEFDRITRKGTEEIDK